MEKIKLNLCWIFGRVYIPNNISGNTEKKILHISDTPLIFFSALEKLIKNTKPDYIIHTGDLVDNIKLSISPTKITEYEKGVKTLILESSSAQDIYITLGNHDNKEIVQNLSRRCILIEKSRIITIDSLQLKISHYAQEILKEPVKYNLFGHDVLINTKIENGKIFLNGIQSINIITTTTKQIFTLPYPLGTNDSRLGKFKFGM